MRCSQAPKSPISTDAHPLKPTPKNKWSAAEDDIILTLRGEGLKWEEIAAHLPDRSAMSCRVRYQNFLERRPLWYDEKKDKLAMLYERLVSRFERKSLAELMLSKQSCHRKLMTV